MYFSGISDEAGQPIESQIKAHKELGWDYMELRMVDGTNITALTDDDFARTYDAVTGAGLKVSCFGSSIANWARPITCDEQIDIDDLKQSIPRMHTFGTEFIRVMSYPNHPEDPIPEPEWRKEAIRRTKDFALIAEDNGIILVHENCSGWGGETAENSNILLGEVDSPALKIVFDTGNPVTYGQNSWAYYNTVKDSIAYIHIKDAQYVEGGEELYVMCGDGDGYVKEIIADLLINGYDSGISIEPHLAAVIHTGETTDPAKLYDSYTAYGRRLMEIVDEVKPK